MWIMPSLPGRISTKAPIGMIRVIEPENTSPSFTLRVRPSMIFWASSAAAPSWDAMVTMPPSSMSILVLVRSVMPLIVRPPGPITVPISSGSVSYTHLTLPTKVRV